MRTIVVGDVHGCIDELLELMRSVGRGPGDRVVLLGDLMDRGPDPVACVRWAREGGAEVCLGNHEEKHVRWRRNERRQAAGGRPNMMKPFDERKLAQHASLSDDDVAWMAALPVTVDLGQGWVGVHAGFEPGVPMERQTADRMTRIRYVERGTSKFVPLGEDFSQPPGTAYWAELYDGARSVAYGHCVHSLTEPRQDEPRPGVFCVGLDTGCVFGGRLTAMVMEPGTRPRFVQVQARREYCPPPWRRRSLPNGERPGEGQ